MLKGETINLRTVRQRDLETLLELSSDLEARGPYFPWTLSTETSLKKRFDEDGCWGEDHGNMLIVDKQDRILGLITFFKGSRYFDALEVGYILYDKESRGKGITTQAVKMFVGYLFKLRNIHRIQILAETKNEASKRVAIKSGFKSEGILRAAVIDGTVPKDLEIFSILRSEFESAPA